MTSLIALIHAEPKAGKSTLVGTMPTPRLVLDAENGFRFVRGQKVVHWNPERDAPPEPGDWTTCVVQVRDFSTITRAYEWLNSGKHGFKSVALDSVTEIQKRCKDALLGMDDVVTERQWGQLLVRMERTLRDFRDLTMHPTNPVECVIFTALTDDKKGKFRAAIQGGLSVSLPGFVDLIGYLGVVEVPEDDGNARRVRRLLVAPHAQFEAGDRTGVFEPDRVIEEPNIESMIRAIAEEMESK